MTNADLRDIAVTTGRAAGEILRRGFGTSFSVTSKEGRHNLVTEYDVACENFIVDTLRSRLPESTFIGEEGGTTSGSGPVSWVIDPLDGTVNFAHGIPIFCVSIAAVVDSDIVAGCIYHPLLDELFAAAKGEGATLNGQRLSVSSTSELGSSLLVTGFPYNIMDNPLRCIEQFSGIVGRGIPVRRLGSAALDLAYVAAGRFDGFWEVELHPWDMAAGVLLVQEAGGRVTHYRNRAFSLGRDSIVATNHHIHDELVTALDEVYQ